VLFSHFFAGTSVRNNNVGWKVVFVKEAWMHDHGLRDLSMGWLCNRRESPINRWDVSRMAGNPGNGCVVAGFFLSLGQRADGCAIGG